MADDCDLALKNRPHHVASLRLFLQKVVAVRRMITQWRYGFPGCLVLEIAGKTDAAVPGRNQDKVSRCHLPGQSPRQYICVRESPMHTPPRESQSQDGCHRDD